MLSDSDFHFSQTTFFHSQIKYRPTEKWYSESGVSNEYSTSVASSAPTYLPWLDWILRGKNMFFWRGNTIKFHPWAVLGRNPYRVALFCAPLRPANPVWSSQPAGSSFPRWGPEHLVLIGRRGLRVREGISTKQSQSIQGRNHKVPENRLPFCLGIRRLTSYYSPGSLWIKMYAKCQISN